MYLPAEEQAAMLSPLDVAADATVLVTRLAFDPIPGILNQSHPHAHPQV